MNKEHQMRLQHLRDAIRKASEYTAIGDWEESLYYVDGARLLLQAIERDERLNRKRQEIQAA